jgi:hypothetical protein
VVARIVWIRALIDVFACSAQFAVGDDPLPTTIVIALASARVCNVLTRPPLIAVGRTFSADDASAIGQGSRSAGCGGKRTARRNYRRDALRFRGKPDETISAALEVLVEEVALFSDGETLSIDTVTNGNVKQVVQFLFRGHTSL